ncbi:MAG TPA: GNAT family N-acetyltransferase [Verrucomicrobiales bacterium]|nr:GNAT family N-acetyltransferase [Verrucomicrobiales bacterium]
MITHFLTEETVAAFLEELLERLREMDNPPDTFFAVTGSGVELLGRLGKLIEKKPECVLRSAKLASFGKTHDNELHLRGLVDAEVTGRRCLLLDSAIHTGGLMNRCRQKLVELKASEICSYSLVVKRGSRHIPTFWGVMIDDLDRAYFCLERIPNNRLSSGNRKNQSHVTISVLDKAHIKYPPVSAGVNSMDRLTWSDRLFAIEASSRERAVRTYVLEKADKVIGFLSTHHDKGSFSVDEVVLDESYRGQGLGGVLIRFAVTIARHHNSRRIGLYAIAEKVELYEKLGFHLVPGAKPIQLDDETYHPMSKRLLHEPLDGMEPDA